MTDYSFPRRWVVLGAIGLATSVLLTVGIALLGVRGVASANVSPAAPTPTRVVAQTLFREIGGPFRTPTPGPGGAVVPTLPFDNEPARAMLRSVDTGAVAGGPTATPAAGASANEPPPPTVPPLADRLAAPLPLPALPPAPPAVTTDFGPTPVPAAPTATALPQPTFPSFFRTPTATSTTVVPTVTPTAVPDDLPVVTLSVSDRTIDIGDSITITVMGSDDRGLANISWVGVDVTDSAFDREARNNCDSKRQCARSWTVTSTHGGTQTIQARARDLSGQVSGAASLDIRVRAAQPTATPTNSPTPRPTATSLVPNSPRATSTPTN